MLLLLPAPGIKLVNFDATLVCTVSRRHIETRVQIEFSQKDNITFQSRLACLVVLISWLGILLRKLSANLRRCLASSRCSSYQMKFNSLFCMIKGPGLPAKQCQEDVCSTHTPRLLALTELKSFCINLPVCRLLCNAWQMAPCPTFPTESLRCCVLSCRLKIMVLRKAPHCRAAHQSRPLTIFRPSSELGGG